jgi:hypothetical protein
MFPDHAEKPILTEGFNPSQPETAVSRSRLHLAAYADREKFQPCCRTGACLPISWRCASHAKWLCVSSCVLFVAS